MPEVSDGDDDEQVEGDGEQGDGGQHEVKQGVLGATRRGLPARRVVQRRVAGVECFSEGLHWLRDQQVQGLVIQLLPPMLTLVSPISHRKKEKR